MSTVAVPPQPQPATSRSLLRRSFGYPQTWIGAAITSLVVLMVLLGPTIAPYSTTEFVDIPFADPSHGAVLGTDAIGRDVLSRTLSGGRGVLWMSLAATLIGVGGGVALGLVAGYLGGVLDNVVMRALDVVLAFPQLVLVLLFVSLLGPKPWLIVLLVGAAWMPTVARITRGMTMEVREREFVQAAELMGLRRRTILLGEILPNLSSPLLVEFALRLAWSITVIAGLSFLGLGVQAPTADWGLMVNENRNALSTQPWSVLAPVAMIALFAFGTSLMAEGFSRAMAGIDRGVQRS